METKETNKSPRSPQKKQEGSIGSGLGLILCAIAVFIFISQVTLPQWLAVSLSVLGLVFLLLGILVTSNELAKEWRQ